MATGHCWRRRALLTAGIQKLMSKMKELTATPLASYSHEWKVVPQQIVPIAGHEGAIRIACRHGEDSRRRISIFACHGIEIEGFNDIGVDVQYPWEDTPRRFHDHPMHVKSFWIDKYPVTNAQFKKFLDATHYHPQDDLNFLRDWKDGNLSRRLGQQAGDVGIARGCTRLRRLGREAAAA